MKQSKNEKVRMAAKAAEQKDDLEAAFKLWDRASRLPDADFWDRFFAVRAAMQVGRLEEASERLLRLKATSHTEAAWVQLWAEIEEKRGRDHEAVDLWRKAVSLQSDPYWALFGLARSLSRLGHHAEARETMAAALALPSAERGGASFAAALDIRSGMTKEAEAKFAAFGFSDDERTRAILAGLPGMTSQAERWALHQIARQLTGVGQVVDLGCWLGSLTVALASGLERIPQVRRPNIRVHAYDIFRWDAIGMDSQWPEGLPTSRPRDGETFLPIFEMIVRPWAQLIEIHESDLSKIGWIGNPIEILSIDAMKSPPIAKHIMHQFYPSLLPGVSFLFHQDFCHHYTWWIHIYHFVLCNHFETVDNLEDSGGVVFKVVRPLSVEDVERAIGCDLSDGGLAREAFAFSMNQVAASDRGAVAAAYIRCEISNGRPERARELLEQYKKQPSAVQELAQVKDGLLLQGS